MAKADKSAGMGGSSVPKSAKAADLGDVSRPAAGALKRGKKPRVATGPTRQAVVVLGMHRTGSSALSRMLNLAGCDLPQTLMGGDASNKTGHWESTVVRALNDDVLASGGSNWQDWHAFNPRWYRTSRPAEFRPRALKVLDEEFGTTGLMVIKDPRMCRIFPFWRDVLDAAGIAPSVLMPIRHPAEVAASLNRRNGIPEVHGLLLWLRHVLEAEYASRGLPRAVVLYDRLMRRPVESMRALQEPLGLHWPRLSQIVSGEIDDFMVPDLRHHKADDEAMSILAFNDWLLTAFSTFERWAATGEDVADHVTLDGVRFAMDRLAVPLSEVVATMTKQATDIAAMDKDITYLRFEAGKRGDAVTALTADLAARTEAAKAERQSIEDRLSETQSALRQRQHEAEETAASLTVAKRELERVRSECDALRKLQVEHERRHELLLEKQKAMRQGQYEAEQAAAALTVTLREQEVAEAARYDEIAQLTQALIKRDEVIASNAAVIFRAIDATLRRADRPWLIGPLRLARKVALLSASGLFDAEWYRQANPDVAKSGMNPARHFIRFGRAEGRRPLPDLAQSATPHSIPSDPGT